MPDTSWFAKCGWGVFCHYLTSADTSADQWNRQIDNFDLRGLASQLHQIGAPYFFITIGQGSGHYCAPNETYDSIVGIQPSKCSNRDLISDLYDVLSPLGIELLAYINACGPWRDHQARKKLKLTTSWNDKKNVDWSFGPEWAEYRLPEFQQNWENVLKDWAIRFGTKVRGWWIDGAYAAPYRYPENEPPNLRTLADALRAGNPNALVAFNSGVSSKVLHYCDYEDFTCGEVGRALPQCRGPFVQREGGHTARFHVLTYIGQDWGNGVPRFPDELLVGYTKHIVSNGGVITWDVPIEPSGLISSAIMPQLGLIGQNVRKH